MDKISLKELANRTTEQEKEFTVLEGRLGALKQAAAKFSHSNGGNDMETVMEHNARLKFRLKHLKEALADHVNLAAKEDYTALQRIDALMQVAVATEFPFIEEIPSATKTCDPKLGDYQCNHALQLLQQLKKHGVTDPPKVIAEKLVAAIPQNDIINAAKVAQPGFINVSLKDKFVVDSLGSLIQSDFKGPRTDQKLKVVVDYSSPNIAKEMHVGHLRSTIIGDSIANLLEFMGHDVLRLNHLGDWGTQFGMLITHLQEIFPNYLKESPNISDLQKFYKEAKKRFDDDEEFHKRALAAVVALQSHEENATKAWKLICEVSYKEFRRIYERLSISKKLQIRGESFYSDLMREIIKRPDVTKHLSLEPEDGRTIMKVPGGQIPLIMVKSDGGFTYDTSDMACIWHRLTVEKADMVLYVIDSGQNLHIDTVIKGAEMVGWYDPNKQRCQHIGFGLVLGEDKKKFKTRSGDTVRLADLLDEGVERAEKKLREKNVNNRLNEDDIAVAKESIAYGCIKYADLSHNRNHDYVFSFDKMLDDRGNTAVYMLYAYTRISSIARSAGVSAEDLKKYLASVPSLPLTHEKEVKLAKKLIQFHEMILATMEYFLMNNVCDYMYDLSCTFSEFYDNCYCIEKDRQTGEVLKMHYHRLWLCEATAAVLRRCFDILGIKPVSKM